MAITKLITPQWVKDRYLVGIDLTDDDGNEYPDEHYKQAIDSAIAEVEAQLSIVIRRPRSFVHEERHDGNQMSSPSWYLTPVRHRPLIELESFSIQFGNYPATQIPTGWTHIVSENFGQIQIIPGPQGFRHPYLLGNTPLMGVGLVSGYRYMPGWVKIRYKAGFERTLPGTVSGAINQKIVTYSSSGAEDDNAIQKLREGDRVYVNNTFYRVADVLSDTQFEVEDPLKETWSGETCVVYAYDPALLELIGLKAAMPILDTAGDLILGAGISSQSLSADGLSQSISSTSGVENSGYGAREANYRKRIDELSKAMRARYRRFNMAVL